MGEQNEIEKETFFPSEGMCQSFSFDLRVKNNETINFLTPQIQQAKYKFENLVIGDKDVVFSVLITINEHNISFKLIRKSQRLEDVTITKCSVCVKVPGQSFMNQVEFPVTTLKSGSDNEKYSTLNCISPSLKWCSATSGARMQHATGNWYGSVVFRIMGHAFYTNPVKQNLQKQMKLHFNNTKTGDVTLVVDGAKFKAHRWLLSARSPVFQAMFNSNMKESFQNTVKLTDDDPNMFREVLEFIYTDKCSNLSKMAPDLLIPADKYNIEGLRSLCESEMMKHLCVDNVCHYVTRSCMTNSKRIYEKCLDFFRKNRKEVLKTVGWAAFKVSPSSIRFMSDIIENF